MNECLMHDGQRLKAPFHFDADVMGCLKGILFRYFDVKLDMDFVADVMGSEIV